MLWEGCEPDPRQNSGDIEERMDPRDSEDIESIVFEREGLKVCFHFQVLCLWKSVGAVPWNWESGTG